ncbi:predicted protein [Histoplasma capsulatum G186AR]|uniref:Uncharacterized protein n=1 Tax=Ajellomyces capsulatus (strain G186AR / H82 / ATCC MYA-2454 / RMSCC 2432) TaxID=447093 RepID=C0NWB5_AJECG|nr:uncharacterized protein HCBG_07445 [Histoplasma capsulatum G186AR]EEH04220.1 predicted protein [Histoplasma capsulatum G186AR]
MIDGFEEETRKECMVMANQRKRAMWRLTDKGERWLLQRNRGTGDKEKGKKGDFQEPKGVGQHDGNSHGPTTQHSHWQSNTIQGRERDHGPGQYNYNTPSTRERGVAPIHFILSNKDCDAPG